MIDLIKNNIKDLETICEKHKVKSLYLFGSAAKNKFIPKKSDLDFVVEFNNTIEPIDFADNFFSLLDALKDLFKTDIDLLSYRALKNQIIIAEIENSKVQLYAA
ncbi:MAG TPA: nucleotidyltransferase domain-containing protein [Vicingus sp.]|nr:nucleotidyltransferase domain-containing protein [Vicingus sp.]HRP60572.1 nucleotidyltransferase domain-containing protein [Vicingus sp.]